MYALPLISVALCIVGSAEKLNTDLLKAAGGDTAAIGRVSAWQGDKLQLLHPLFSNIYCSEFDSLLPVLENHRAYFERQDVLRKLIRRVARPWQPYRNAIEFLKNTGTPGYLRVLCDVATQGDRFERRAAGFLLGDWLRAHPERITPSLLQPCHRALVAAMLSGPDEVSKEATVAILRINRPEVIPMLPTSGLADRAGERVVFVLRNMPCPASRMRLTSIGTARGNSSKVRRLAIAAPLERPPTPTKTKRQ